ncbi:MAG: hypothetical protein ACRD4I_08935, partial [Candidatus Angelobacter sp.]
MKLSGVLGSGPIIDPQTSAWFPLLVVGYLFASWYLTIIIHETGHLIAGLCSGFQLNFVRFGPLQINLPFRLSLQPKLGISAAGLASMVPGKETSLRLASATMLLEGPLLNLATAGLLVAFFRPFSSFGLCFAGISAFTGVANLVPFIRGGAVSDGSRILMILRNSPRGKRWLAILQLVADSWKGASPEELNPKLLADATSLA